MNDLFLHTYTKKGIDGVLIFISVPINHARLLEFFAQHSVAMLEHCSHSKKCRNNVEMTFCVKDRCCKSSRITPEGCYGGSTFCVYVYSPIWQFSSTFLWYYLLLYPKWRHYEPSPSWYIRRRIIGMTSPFFVRSRKSWLKVEHRIVRQKCQFFPGSIS